MPNTLSEEQCADDLVKVTIVGSETEIDADIQSISNRAGARLIALAAKRVLNV